LNPIAAVHPGGMHTNVKCAKYSTQHHVLHAN